MLVLGIFSLMTAIALPNVKISSVVLTRIASIILLYAAFLSWNTLNIKSLGVSIYSGLFQVTSVSQFIDTFVFIIGALILLPWAPIVSAIINGSRTVSTALPFIAEYPLIILFSVCGASFLMSSADLVSIYLSIELQSFRVYILATLYRDSESATSAGLKYFLLGGLSSGLILLGSRLIYASTGLTNLENIYIMVSVGTIDNLMSILGPLGIIILTIGFLFKVSRAPFHNWAPDVYDGVPTIVTTWLTTMPKISIFVIIIPIRAILTNPENSIRDTNFDRLKNLLLVSSVLSLIIGTVVGLAQYRIKRLLAYSTISHVGFLLLALAVNSEESIESFLFYLVQYSVTNLNAFLIILAFGYIMYNPVPRSDGRGTDVQFISDLSGQFRANPLLGLALTLCLFSIRGVPPLIGFFGKQIVLYSATHSGYYFLSIVAIIVSVISASYYLKIVRVIHFDARKRESTRSERNKLTNMHSYAIRVLTLRITMFVLYPSIILNSISLLALTVFGR
jgi:NADH-ubiquinone oxidoreductase chain 2